MNLAFFSNMQIKMFFFLNYCQKLIAFQNRIRREKSLLRYKITLNLCVCCSIRGHFAVSRPAANITKVIMQNLCQNASLCVQFSRRKPWAFIYLPPGCNCNCGLKFRMINCQLISVQFAN